MWRSLLLLLAGILAAVPVVHACSVSAIMWSIRSVAADGFYRFVRDGMVGYIDARGKIVVPPTLPRNADFADREFHEGLLVVPKSERPEVRGALYLDPNGRAVFQTSFWGNGDFSEGLAPASPKLDTWGFMDRSGQLAIPPQFVSVGGFSDGLARVDVSREENATGFVDKQGVLVMKPTLRNARDFHEGRAAAILEGPCRLMNGGSCAPPEYLPTKRGVDCRWAFIDKTGQPISTLRFDEAKDFSEGLAPVRIGKLWGYVDLSGQLAISPQFEAAEPFSEGLAAVRMAAESRYIMSGFINRAGRVVIQPKFDFAGSFANGRAVVSRVVGNHYAQRFIDTAGNSAFPGEFANATSFHKGLALVRIGYRQFAWIDPSGKRVFTYEEK
ncbi:MAG: WG repeat-containing protein [Bryobacteraceae bacterium]